MHAVTTVSLGMMRSQNLVSKSKETFIKYSQQNYSFDFKIYSSCSCLYFQILLGYQFILHAGANTQELLDGVFYILLFLVLRNHD